MVTTGQRGGQGINQEERPNKYKLLLTKHIIRKKKKQYLPREVYPTLCINLHGKRIQTCIAIRIRVKVSVYRQHIQHYCSVIPNNEEGTGTPLQYSCLENPMDAGAWQAAVHGVAKSWTRLSDFTFIFHFHALEKEMATHSSVLAWRIPGTGELGGLPSMGFQSRTRLK